MIRLLRRGGRSRPLAMIASLCVASAALRLADGSGAAIAREVASLSPYRPILTEGETCTPDPDVEEVLASLSQRETRLNEREARLVRKQVIVSEAEGKIARKLAELRAAEDSLRAMLALAEGAAEADVERLTTVYERMKPKDASRLFETMAPEFSAGFLGRMNPEAAAAILAGLTPEVAYSVSAILAGRHADIPEE